MQTIRGAQRTRMCWTGMAGALWACVAALMACVVLALSLVVAPAPAWAKSYSMPEVAIQAEVLEDGTLHVVERRVFRFDGSFTTVWWTQGSLPQFGAFQVNGMQMAIDEFPPDDIWATPLQDVPEVPFETLWRSEGGPGATAYSVDVAEATCYLFFDVTDKAMVAQIDYQISNAVELYDDCAELYWKFVPDGWGEDSQNVTCVVTLPVPAGEQIQPEGNVRAWGHGTLGGTVSFDEGAPTVTFHIDQVNSGDFGEARITFPTEWITNPSNEVAQAHAGQGHLDDVLAEEQAWADEANRERMKGRLGILGTLLAGLAAIVWGVVMFFRHGREHKPTQKLDYWRDEPEKGVHPAVIARLWKWNKEDADQISATIMHLANEGAFQVSRSTYEQKGGLLRGSRTVQDYCLTLNPNYVPTTSIDRATIDLLFNKAGSGGQQMWLHELKDYATSTPTGCRATIEHWHEKLTDMVQDQGYFDDDSSAAQGTMRAAAFIVAACAIVGTWFTESLLPVALLVPALVLGILGRFVSRRTQKGADVYERCRALRRWLTEFTAINERPASDVKVWGLFMVYAYIFGVADKAIAELRKVAPDFFAQQERMMQSDGSYVPFYYYYHSAPGAGSSFADALGSSMQTVQAAITPESSGGGGGGGFSGGGGGGFGGGGGGGAR